MALHLPHEERWWRRDSAASKAGDDLCAECFEFLLRGQSVLVSAPVQPDQAGSQPRIVRGRIPEAGAVSGELDQQCRRKVKDSVIPALGYAGAAGVDGVSVQEQQASLGRVLSGAPVADRLNSALDGCDCVLAVGVGHEVVAAEGCRHESYVAWAVAVLDHVRHDFLSTAGDQTRR